MNQSVIINILLKADQTQAGAAAFNNVLKEVVKSAQKAGRDIKEALNQAFGASNLQGISAQAKLLQSLANLTNAQAKQEAQQSRLKHAQTVAQGKIELEQVKQLNREKQRAAVAGSPAGVARSVAAASNAEAAALRVLTVEKNRDAAASRAQAAASTAQAAAARAAAAQARSTASINRTTNSTSNAPPSSSNAGSGGFLSTVVGGNLAANLAAKAISFVTQNLQDGATAVFNYSAALEVNRVAFTRLLGLADDANKTLEFTQSLTAQTGLSFEDAARRILNTGEALDDTLPLIEALGKAIVGAGKGQAELNRIALAIEQIISAQRLLGQDANQLKELGFNAYKIVGDEIGKTSAEVRNLAQQGKISSDVFINAFEKFINNKYASAYEDQLKSFSGSLVIIQGRLTQLLSNDTGIIFEAISKGSQAAARDIQQTDSALVGLIAILGGAIVAFREYQRSAGQSITNSLVGGFSDLFAAGPDNLLVQLGITSAGNEAIKEQAGLIDTLSQSISDLITEIPLIGAAYAGVQQYVKTIFIGLFGVGGDPSGINDPAQLKQIQNLEARVKAYTKAQLDKKANADAASIKELDDILRDLNLRIQFFGDDSQVAATKQDLLRHSIDLNTDAGAQNAVALAAQLDALKESSLAAETLKKAQEGLKAAKLELRDVSNYGQLTELRLETEQVQQETKYLYDQIKARQELDDIQTGGGLIGLRLETEQLQEVVNLSYSRVKAVRELAALKKQTGPTTLKLETDELTQQVSLTYNLLTAKRRLADVKAFGPLTQLDLENQKIQDQLNLYTSIRTLRQQLSLPQNFTITNGQIGQEGQKLQLDELVNLRQEIFAGYKDTVLQLNEINDQTRLYVSGTEKLNRNLERFLQLRKAQGGSGVFSLDEQSAVTRARQAASQIDSATYDSKQLLNIRDLTDASNRLLNVRIQFGRTEAAYRGQIRETLTVEQEIYDLRKAGQLIGIDDKTAKININARRTNEFYLEQERQTAKLIVDFAEQARQTQRELAIFGKGFDEPTKAILAFIAALEDIPVLKLNVGDLSALKTLLGELPKDKSLVNPKISQSFINQRDFLANPPKTHISDYVLGPQRADIGTTFSGTRPIEETFGNNVYRALQKVVPDFDTLPNNVKIAETIATAFLNAAKAAENLNPVLQESASLVEQLRVSTEEYAVVSENAALRYKLAYQKAYNEVVLADQYAREQQIASQVKLADAQVFHADQANAKVLDFLASQKTLTDVIADTQIGVIKTVYDTIDSGLGKLTQHLKIAGDLVKELLSGFIKLALNKYFQQFFGGGGQDGGGSQGGGGVGSTIFGNLIPGLGGGRGIGPGGTPYFNPNAGTNFAYADGGGLAPLAPFINTGGLRISNPDLPITTTLPGPQGTLIGTTATGGIIPGIGSAAGSAGSLASLFKGFGFNKKPGSGGALSGLAPLLGASLGSGLGGGSRLGQLLGGIGGAAVGIGAVAAPAFLSAGIFAPGIAGVGGGALGGLGSAATALFSNPFTIAAGAALLVGAILLGRNSARRAAEKQSTTIRTDAKGKLQDILSQVKRGQLPTASAIQQANAIRASYLDEVGKIKDKKTRNIGLALVRELDAIIAQIKTEGARQDQARELDKIIVPTFATGGSANFQRYNGLVGDRGLGAGDVIPAFINRTETVINAAQRDRLGGKEAMRRAGVPGYGTVAAPPAYPTPALASGGNFSSGIENSGFSNFMAVIVADEQTADDFVARAQPGTFAKKIVLAKRDDPGFVDRLFG